MSSDEGQVNLSEICEDVSYGYTESATNDPVGPKFLRITDIQGGSFDWSKVPYCPASDENIKKYRLEIGDILIARTGNSTGENAQVITEPPAAVFASYLIRFRPDSSRVNPFFVGYQLRSEKFRQHVLAVRGGSAQPGANAKQLGAFPVQLIARERQDAAVEILRSLDDRISLMRETNVTLEAIAQALFKSWFVDFDPVRAKMEGRAPEDMDEATAALFPDSFEELEWGAVPRGWRVGAFSDVCDIASGKRPPDRSDSAEVGNETPLYGGAGIMGYTSMPLFDDRKILTGRVGTLGKVHIAYPPFWASDNVLVITPKDQSCFSLVLHWLRTIDVLALNRGSTQPLLTQRDLGAQRGVIPPSHVVAEFEEVVEPLYQRIQEQEVQVQTLASLRDTLLPRLISGQLSLLDAESTISEAQV